MNKRVWALTKKEFKAYFDSPTAYILLIVWLVAAAYFFFRVAISTSEASLRPLFEVLPWLLLFFIPAVTMRSLSAEKKDGTIELLLTHPISEAEVVAGKLAANVGFALIALALTLPIPLGLLFGGSFDFGMVTGQYIGALWLIVGLSAVGLFASSLGRNQTMAFIVSLALTFLLIVTGMEFILIAAPWPLTAIFQQISALSHFQSMTRGVITINDVAYFAALTMIFSTLSYYGLRSGREPQQSARHKSLRTGTALIIVICVLGAMIGSTVGGRLDLTSGRLYSLSGATVKLVRDLRDPVTIKLYASQELPPETAVALRDIKDTLVDYQATSGGRVKVIFKSPEDGPAAQQEMQDAGIQTVQFNVVRQRGMEVNQGYLGLTVEYQNKREAIPFVKESSDLEYRLSSLIRKVSLTKRKKIAFLDGFGATGHTSKESEQEDGGYNAWRSKLSEQYNVVDIKLDKGQAVPNDVSTLVIAGPRGSASPGLIKELNAYVKRGGSILALIDGLDVNPKMMYVLPLKNSFIDFVGKHGFKVEPKLLYDLKANQPINAGNEGNMFAMPYPFWMQVGPVSDNIVVRDIRAVTVPWASPIMLGRQGKDDIVPLLATTQFAGMQTKDFKISPDPNMPVDQNQLRSFLVAAGRKFKGGGRMVVVGDADFLKDQFAGAPGLENMTFGLNSVDWLAQDASLAAIRAKTGLSRRLVWPSDSVRDLVRYFNLVGLPILVAIFGAVRLSRRRRLTRRVYAR